jgi:hypothetical protein
MEMKKLFPVDTIMSTDFLKARSAQKAVPVQHCAGLKVGDIDLYMDDDFEGFFRGIGNDKL